MHCQKCAGTLAAACLVDQLIHAWHTTTVSACELASMLPAAGHVVTKAAKQQSTELVWTGLMTPANLRQSIRTTDRPLIQIKYTGGGARYAWHMGIFHAKDDGPTPAGVALLIDRFYDKIRAHPTLGSVFNAVATLPMRRKDRVGG